MNVVYPSGLSRITATTKVRMIKKSNRIAKSFVWNISRQFVCISCVSLLLTFENLHFYELWIIEVQCSVCSKTYFDGMSLCLIFNRNCSWLSEYRNGGHLVCVSFTVRRKRWQIHFTKTLQLAKEKERNQNRLESNKKWRNYEYHWKFVYTNWSSFK